MGLLTDLWKSISEFLQIEAVEPIVPETKEPPKPYEPVESVTTLPEKSIAEAPIEEIEPLPIVKIIEPTPIGEQGRADRIEVLPAKEEPEPKSTGWGRQPSISNCERGYKGAYTVDLYQDGEPRGSTEVTYLDLKHFKKTQGEVEGRTYKIVGERIC